MKQMTFLFTVAEVIRTFLPRFFILHQSLDQICVIFELRVYHFYIFIVFSKQGAYISERRSYFLTQNADGLRLIFSNASQETFSFQKNAVIEIIPTFTIVVSYLIDLADYFT